MAKKGQTAHFENMSISLTLKAIAFSFALLYRLVKFIFLTETFTYTVTFRT